MDTILLAWNPKRWDWNNLHEEVNQLATEGSLIGRWSCGTRKNIPIGSRFFLIRLGENPKGIIGSGYTTNLPQQDEHFINPDKLAWYIDIRFDVLSEQPIISREFLNLSPFNEFHWDTQMSGINISPSLVTLIEKEWTKQLQIDSSNIQKNENKLISQDKIKSVGDKIYEKVESFLVNNILNEMELTFLALLKERGNLGLSSVETRELFGFKHIIQANRLISQIGKKYLKYAGIDFSNIRSLYEIVSDPEKNYRDENGFFKWVLREPFSKNVDSIISRIDNIATFYFIEGRRTKVENTYYERNIKARKKCIEHYGFICKICGFDFSKAYGEIGKGYIEVHHLVPIHEKKIEYHINPINDLIPVCSNCHSIIHRKNPPYCEEEIKDIINKKL